MRGLAILAMTALLLAPASLPAQSIEQRPVLTRYTDCGVVDESPNICRLPLGITASVALSRLGDENFAHWVEGDVFTVLARRNVDQASIGKAIQAPLERVNAPNLWGIRLRLAELDQAILDVNVQQDSAGKTYEWRGPKAPPPPARAAPLQGTMTTKRIDSVHLGHARDLHVYQPPGFSAGRRYPVIYAADGQGAAIASLLEPLIVAGRLPPLVVVGIESGKGTQRFHDYVGARFPGTFAKHEAFFLKEVMPLAESSYGASDRAQDRMLVGTSNGADWAIATATLHPDLFGRAAGLSAAAFKGEGMDTPGRPKLFLSAGLYEPGPLRITTSLAERARKGDGEVMFVKAASGHSLLSWYNLYVEAALWAFGREPFNTQFIPG